uniref:Olfactory receptor n=1 Tax=Leptobrachium leishanense TaxID=445787 RepID=A0A8C5QK86_9ANUR
MQTLYNIHQLKSLKKQTNLKYSLDVLRFVTNEDMQNYNMTASEDGFFLLGLEATTMMQNLTFASFSAAYILTVFGNFTIIFIIRAECRLHTPMYFFLANLALIEIIYPSSVIPNTLHMLVKEDKRISFAGCFIQMFIFITLGGSECILLGIMAYDRYVAICNPLLYTTIMGRLFCLHLVLICWAVGFLNSLLHTVLAGLLPFCADRHIKHFFCEIPCILKLSCKNTSLNEMLIFFLGGSITVGSLTLILVSYACIVVSVVRIRSLTGKHKTFSTCISHLIVVSVFFGTVISIYIRPTSQTSDDENRIISVVYGVFTPLFNPIIYSFRNQEFQRALLRVLQAQTALCSP